MDLTSLGNVSLTSTTLIIFVAVFLLLVCAQYYFKNKRFYELGDRFPGPRVLPFIGSGHLFISSTDDNILNKIVDITDKYESPFRVWMGHSLFVVVTKPSDIQIVLNNSHTMGKSSIYKYFRNTVGEGLFSAPVSKWRKNRRIITPTFNSRLLRSFMGAFNSKTDTMIEKLKKEVGTDTSFDLWKYTSAVALDTICQTAMGYDLNSDAKICEEFSEALLKLSAIDTMRAYKLWLRSEMIFKLYTYLTGVRRLYKTLHWLPNQVIKKRKVEYELEQKEGIYSEEDGTGTFLNALLQLNNNGANFTNKDILDEVVTMMIGGSETTAITNSFTMLMLAMHEDIQEKVYKEITGIMHNADDFMDVDDVNRMVFLEQCIKETLRLFPVAAVIFRHAEQDTKLSDGRILPEGANILLAPVKLHRDEEIYENPLIWNPDNFSEENVKKRHPYSFVAFSGGPRGCIGAKYAMLSMKVTISKILLNYRLKTDIKLCDIKLKLDVLMRSVDGYAIKMYSRE